MAVLLNADTGAVSGISGLTTTADNSGILQFQSSGTATLTITTAGNVGIGTASPATKLDVNGAVTATSVNSQNTFGFKNRIINGAMVIDQRNAGASVTPTDNSYTIDRWQSRLSQASKYSVQQSSVAPAGFKNSLLVTSLSAYTVGASEFFQVRQIIEGFNTADLSFGTASAQTITLSFWVRSSLTGTFGGVLSNADGTRTYVFSYSISSANTWEQKSITIVGDTTGTWLTDKEGGFTVAWTLGAGASVSTTAGVWNASLFRGVTGGTSVVGTNGATFYITGVQLEKGSTATSFDYRPYGTELALCQRYYYHMVANATAVYLRFAYGQNVTSNATEYGIPLPVTMRSTPSLITTGNPASYGVYYANAVTACNAGPTLSGNGTNSTCVTILSSLGTNPLAAGGAAAFLANNTANAFLGLSAEL
jgi:hypothetical protein